MRCFWSASHYNMSYTHIWANEFGSRVNYITFCCSMKCSFCVYPKVNVSRRVVFFISTLVHTKSQPVRVALWLAIRFRNIYIYSELRFALWSELSVCVDIDLWVEYDAVFEFVTTNLLHGLIYVYTIYLYVMYCMTQRHTLHSNNNVSLPHYNIDSDCVFVQFVCGRMYLLKTNVTIARSHIWDWGTWCFSGCWIGLLNDMCGECVKWN